MTILALDPANTTGWAWSDRNETRYGTWSLVVPNRPADHRLVVFLDLLRRIVAATAVELIAFEEASFGSPNRRVQAMHNELRGIIKLVAAERGIEVVGYHPTTIKKFATGSGRASKSQMIAAARTMLGLYTSDDNVADAAFILALAQRGYRQTTPAAWRPKRPRRPAQSKLF